MLTECGLLPAGMVGYRFNTVGVSDAISMGTDGMSFSLQSRDLIADSVETVMGAQVRAKFGRFHRVLSHPAYFKSHLQLPHTTDRAVIRMLHCTCH